MTKKRVVITGLGTVNPLGNSVSEFWNNVRQGKSGINRITRFDTDEFSSKIAGEVKNFDAKNYLDGKEARKLDPFVQYALVSAIEAMNDAELSENTYDPERSGVILGCGIGGLISLEDAYEKLFDKGPKRIPVLLIPKMISNIGPGNIAIRYKFSGPCYSVATACASATDAIGAAADWIRRGETDVMITGGVEACITKVGLGGFIVIKALSTGYNDQPEKASRPFDKNRDGFVMGEGAGVLVLESLEHAEKRGAKIYAELTGYGITCDAYHVTAPHPEGTGAARAIQKALDDAGIGPKDVDYINAHGTSTPLNDPVETKAIKIVFGEHAYTIKVSSTKSMTGHCIGAAGGIEAITTVLALKDQFYPPTINLEEPDPECDLDYVPNKGMKGTMQTAISNSLGFGGHNSVIALSKRNNL